MNWDAVFNLHGWFHDRLCKITWDESPDTFATAQGFEAAGWEVN